MFVFDLSSARVYPYTGDRESRLAVRGSHMKKTLLSFALMIASAWILSGCGSEGGTGEDGGVTPGTELALFSEKVRESTPYLEETSPGTGTFDLSSWGGWDPGATHAVLGTLFDSGIGARACIHTVAQTLDDHIELVNSFTQNWGASGTYTAGGMTASVQTDVPAFVVPYLGFDTRFIALDRLVTLEKPSDGLTVHMAFAQSPGGNQTIIEQYTRGTGEAGVYIAQIQQDKVRIWYAGVSGAGGNKVQVLWEGNTTDQTFKISVCTNAAGGSWEAMGGGSVSSSTGEIAVMARNNAASQAYYVVLARSELERGRQADIVSAATDPPGTAGAEVYINEENGLCLGFLGTGAYPDDIGDLAWSVD